MVSSKLMTCKFASNPPLFSKMRHLFLKSATTLHKPAGFSKNSQVLAQKSPLVWEGDGLGRHLVSPLLAVNSSSFALFFLIVSHMGSFIDANCPS